MAPGARCLWPRCGKVYATLCRASREKSLEAANGAGLDERRDENRTHQPPAGTKETGPGVAGIDGSSGKVLLVELIGS